NSDDQASGAREDRVEGGSLAGDLPDQAVAEVEVAVRIGCVAGPLTRAVILRAEVRVAFEVELRRQDDVVLGRHEPDVEVSRADALRVAITTGQDGLEAIPPLRVRPDLPAEAIIAVAPAVVIAVLVRLPDVEGIARERRPAVRSEQAPLHGEANAGL